jgi:hypothetical protein
VQVASVEREEDAEPEWRRLQRRHPDLLRSLDLDVERAELPTRVVYRLRAGPLPDRTRAEGLCNALRQQRLDCLVRVEQR